MARRGALRLSLPAAVGLAAAVSGCFAHVQHLPAASAPAFAPIEDRAETVVGLALSGGGSRAAYFGAAGLEALAPLRAGPERRSMLEGVSHVSSVSGGSVASSYFVTRKPGAAVRVLTADGSLTAEYQAFFAGYRGAMAQNFQRSVVLRQLLKVRWFNSNQRATSLAEVLDDRFLEGATLASLYERERRGDSPRLILNCTLYNNGRRFVITTIPREDFRYDFIRKLQAELEAKSAAPKPLPDSLKRAREALNPLTFEDEQADPRAVHLAYGVAASASFPFFVGPITVQVQGDNSYVHAGDGGLFDNQGTESLVQLFLKKLESGNAKRALVVAFDSSFPFWVKNDTLDYLENGFDIFVKDAGRIVGIMEQRANAYQAMVWHILQSQRVVLPDDSIIRVIVIRHTDDVWPTDWKAAIPQACHDEGAIFLRREHLVQRLALIPTLFKLTSECDKALLGEAARRGVERKQDEIMSFLRGAP